MTAEIKSWTEANTDDFLKVVKSRFPDSSLRIVQRMLENPLRSICSECGDVAYENGVPQVVQGAILRKLYFGQDPFLGVVGGMLGAEKDASPISIINVMKRTILPRGGAQIYFANTACPSSLKMNRLLKVMGQGPVSCAHRRFAVIRAFSFFIYILRRKILRLSAPTWRDALPKLKPWSRRERDGKRIERQLSIEKRLFDVFWCRYLKTNRGLVCSRTGAELDWMFEDRVQSGRVVILSLSDADGVAGYIALGTAEPSARRWLILDLIAIENKGDLILKLLKGAKQFLRHETPAMVLESIGFPDVIQGTLAKVLPFQARLACNYYLWKQTSHEGKFDFSDLLLGTDHWFFGPYDGDMCM